jgi:hypothetical protein
MAFKNLEERFNSTVDKLYAGATSKFANGVASKGKTDDPLIVRTPGKGYLSSFESRMLPVKSTIEDVKRLTLFQISKPGLLFLAKQQLLQTGNTFEVTRLINPLFVVGNAVPFLHVKRNLRPLKQMIGKTDTSYDNVKKLGQLQVGTYNSTVKNWKIPSYISSVSNSKKSSLFSKLGNAIKNVATSALDTVTSLVNPKLNIGDTEKGWSQSRPELAPNNIVDVVQGFNQSYHADVLQKFTEDKNLSIKNAVPFIAYFTSPDGIKADTDGSVDGTTGPLTVKAKRTDDPLSKGQLKPGRTGKISYLRDPLNTELTNNSTNKLQPYKKLLSPAAAAFARISDAITVSFAIGKNDHIQFRAFIKDLQQSATPTYTQLQYIGRTEKFINYTGVQREVSFKLGIIAFSKDELDVVWKRINYITSFVYPYGFNKGIMQPNIVRMTIGNVYMDQPGYITSLNTNFSGVTDTWELDNGRQVPISAEMDIKFTLIEKFTKIASSPFYGITEKMTNDFVEPIKVPVTQQQAKNNPTKNAPRGEQTETYSIESRDKKDAETFKKLTTLDPNLFRSP